VVEYCYVTLIINQHNAVFISGF